VCTTQDIWQGTELIYIERQISLHKNIDRQCLLIEFCIGGIFLTLYKLNQGPKPIFFPASWWKRQVGLDIARKEAGLEASHDINKQVSIQHFIRFMGRRCLRV
jgi:hypothetical protein